MVFSKKIMKYPDDILTSFAKAEKEIQALRWYDENWSCCSGLWESEKYGRTVVLRISKRNWTSVFPIAPHAGGDIQYTAWIDEALCATRTVRFELHIFSFPGAGGKKIKKSDFTNTFRSRARKKIASFGCHDMWRGPAVPYAGEYTFISSDDLSTFLVSDFGNFQSISSILDKGLLEISG